MFIDRNNDLSSELGRGSEPPVPTPPYVSLESPGPGMRILIADDEDEFIDFMKERLTGQGHHIDAAGDGGRALELLKANKYDIAFFDHSMPGLSGLELAKYVKENNVRLKVVMVTGYEEMSDSFAKAAGVDEYLTKPIRIKDLEDIIKKCSKGKK